MLSELSYRSRRNRARVNICCCELISIIDVVDFLFYWLYLLCFVACAGIWAAIDNEWVTVKW